MADEADPDGRPRVESPSPPWSVDSETGVLTDVLLCPPDHYDWIPTNDIARRTLAGAARLDMQTVHAQYRELEDALEGAGVTRHYLVPRPGLPYQVYTRDSSQVTPWGVLLTQLERPQRRGELGPVLDFYGGAFWRVASAGTLEGGDIHVIGRSPSGERLMAVGHSGGRTTEGAARELAGWFEERGWSACLVPFAEHFLHLDVLFSMVAEGLALACTSVLDDAFLAWLGRHGIRLVDVSYKEAMLAMGCNVLALGRGRVVSPRHSARINAALRAEGLSVLDPALDAFAAGGGSVHCMTMPLRREPA